MRKACIIGGGKKLGRAIALGFAQRNWQVGFTFFHSFDEAQLTLSELTQLNANPIAIRADARSESDMTEAIAGFAKHFGDLDLLLVNAGVFPERLNLKDITASMFEEALDINLRTAFIASREFAKNASKEARIVVIGSVGGVENWKGRLPYNVSKAALIHLVKSLALELAPEISVNCVSPGVVDYPNEDGFIPFAPERIPMKRFASSQDILEAVVFFAESTNYITGQNLFVDGGYHISR